jgi:hypothetical protein
MRFRNLWVAYLLLCGQVAWADQRILIIGDSISEHIYCWPNEMRLIDPQMNLQLHTQASPVIWPSFKSAASGLSYCCHRLRRNWNPR